MVKDKKKSLEVKTKIKAGTITANHNETMVRGKKKSLKIKTNIKAGAPEIGITKKQA